MVLRLTIVGGWLVLAIEGEVDILVGWLVPDLVRRGTSLLVFDLHDVTFMDARGLGMIAVVPPADVPRAIETLGAAGIAATLVGEVVDAATTGATRYVEGPLGTVA